MKSIQNICVFCGSSTGIDPIHQDAAKALGHWLAAKDIGLIYGGGRIGLMGLVADTTLASGGQVVGIIPQFLHDFEVAHQGVQELIITGSMHERKKIMYERADAFVSLPGGLGTLDETFEVLTWTQLGLSAKPVLLLDTGGYWQPLITLIDHCVDMGFAKPENRRLFRVISTIEQIPDAIADIRGDAQARPNVDSKLL
ncbi:MAG: TIGR00730 family Rossman fold protein [Rhodospirillaceae bacterium]|jgi:uncharacterized protein (TIGR00730 family)|nr:TIGR00730 family Rossman fold protein [Rhodospirillaceae bacterium]MBT6135942.1 TIGR00730 family Rossman fold protein [Rhodospirillaceae bacterium]